MRIPIVIRQIGLVLVINALFLFISFLISWINNESSTVALLYATFITLLFGLFPLVFVPGSNYLSTLEGISIVVFGWIATCLTGTLPYVIWGGEFTFVNAWFESVSGFTTTGSSILADVENLTSGLLFWRSSTHWIGGVGVIVFALLILPPSATSHLVLLNAEISGLAKQNFRSRSKQIVRILALVYIGLTLSETLLLWIFGMSFFDAINHAFATIATGGFSTKNLSIAAYQSVAIEVIIMLFMLFSGIHFGLIYATFTGSKDNIFRSPIVKYYLLVMVAGIFLVTLKLYYSDFGSLAHSLRYAAFQVISVGTTTGFATIDTAMWPFFTILVLIYFTIQCACVGSTSGGLKFDRVFIFFRSIGRQIKLIQHPRGVFQTRVGKKIVTEEIENQTHMFILLYLFIVFIVTLALTAYNIDLLTSFSASVTTIGNVGPGFGGVSSLGNFGQLPDGAKLILSVNMLLGRLEIMSILSLFFIKSWR